MSLPNPNPTAPENAEPRWSRLSLRMLLVQSVVDLRHAILLLFPVLAFNVQRDPVEIPLGFMTLTADTINQLALVGAALSVIRSVAHVLSTRYRVTAYRLEYRTGLLSPKRKVLPRDRIREVKLKAILRYRMVGLTAVDIGTGTHNNTGTVRLPGITRREATRLHDLLLPADTTEAPSAPRPLVTAPLRWMWYAPLTFSGSAVTVAVLLGADHLAYYFGVDWDNWATVRDLVTWMRHSDLVLVLLLTAVSTILVTSLLSVPLYLVVFWRFAVTRYPGGTLGIRRGLLTTRSTTVQEHRIRGVSRHVPLQMRAVRAAQAHLVVGGAHMHSPILLPAAPRDRVHDAITAVLGTDHTAASLQKHPRGALRRRLLRAVTPTLLAVAVLFWLSCNNIVPDWTWVVTVCCLPLAVVLGWHRYRMLGHIITGDYLVSSSGSLHHVTAAVLRRAVTDVSVHQTLFQRRAGLATVKPYLAAGNGGYPVHDMAEEDVTTLAEQVLPEGVLTPFLADTPAAPSPPLVHT